jgi:Protein of unknown function (DUF3987)
MLDQAWRDAQIPVIEAESAQRQADMRARPYYPDRPYGPPPGDETSSYEDLERQWATGANRDDYGLDANGDVLSERNGQRAASAGSNAPPLPIVKARNILSSDMGVWHKPVDLLRGTAEPAPAFPETFLPDIMARYASDAARRMQAPLDFIAIPLLIGAATVIGKAFYLAPKAADNWAERACLWGGIIGDVASGKTPSFKTALAPVWRIEAALHQQNAEAMQSYQRKIRAAELYKKQWEKVAKAAIVKGDEPPPLPDAADPGDAPVMRQIIVNDTPQEKLARIIEQEPRGVLLFRDELSGWFASFNQYRAGADEQFYLECHAGGVWKQARVNGDVFIPDIFLNVLGGFQPQVVKEALGARAGHADNGMPARFSLLVYPDPAEGFEYVDTRADRAAEGDIHQLFERLAKLDPESFVGPKPKDEPHYRPLRFSAEAQIIFRDWYIGHNTVLRNWEERNDPFLDLVARIGR